MNEKRTIKLIHSRTYRPMDFQQLVDTLRIPVERLDEFQSLLETLEEAGETVKLPDNRYVNPARENLVVGCMQCSPSGFGFVLARDRTSQDVYVGQESMGSAMHGDIVAAQIRRTRSRRGRRWLYGRKGPSGRIVKVLKRANKRIVGSFRETAKRTGRLVPDDPRIFQSVSLKLAEGLSPRPNDKVVAKVVRWPSRHHGVTAELVEVLGRDNSPAVDFYQIITEFEIERDFPQQVTAAADAAPNVIPEAEIKNRRDFRQVPTITIDPANAKDFDDALSLYCDKKTGNTIVLVSISDVSWYIRPGKVLSDEAMERGMSLYMGDFVVPMLPQRLSSDLCSLIEGKDRLAKTVMLEFNSDAELIKSVIVHSVVRVDLRMSFEDANRVIEANADGSNAVRTVTGLNVTPRIVRMLIDLANISGKLGNARKASGSLDFDMPDFDLVTDAAGAVIGVSKVLRNTSSSLVEEMMLAANREVARFMRTTNIPCIYRLHDKPEPEDIEVFADFVRVVTGRTVDAADRGDVQELLDSVAGTPLAEPVCTQLLRAFKRAEYSAKPGPHYGLHFDTYCHFTSPVRRYPDLVVHQLIDHYFAGRIARPRDRSRIRNRLARAAKHCTEVEYRYTEAEREFVKVSLLRFLQKSVGDVFDGVITGFIERGFFVQLTQNSVEGMVKAASIEDDHYRLDSRKHAFVGARKGRRFTLGDRVRVSVDSIDVRRRLADFVLAD